MMVIEVLKTVYANYGALAQAIVPVLTILIAVFMVIPGEQPEKFLAACVAFLSKFSKK
jgi:hypothetical protein